MNRQSLVSQNVGLGLLCVVCSMSPTVSSSPFKNDSINFFVPFSKGCLWGGTSSSVDTTHGTYYFVVLNVLLFTLICLNTKGRPQEEASPFLEY